jgi:hypothetical protein
MEPPERRTVVRRCLFAPGEFLMGRFALCFGLCLLVAAATGCCRGKKCNYGCSGCGERYMGAYVDDPPRCEPCDGCGNWTGGGGCGCASSSCCDSCGHGGGFFDFIGSFFGNDKGCCDSCTESCCEEPACGEPSCGDPGCGCGGSGHGVVQGEYISAQPRWSKTRPVSHSRVVETAGRHTAGACNCGRH